MMRLALLALMLAAPLALAGTREAPEVSDEEGDCALPYAGGYLDITAAWIEPKDADSFFVATRLAGFDGRLAEGAGYVVQFEDGGLTWGVVATFRQDQGGWGFFTGQVDMERVNVDTLQPREGSFDGTTIRIRFPTAIFEDGDGTIGGFFAGSADLRPAYPFLLAGDRVVPDSSDAKWLVCDTAESDAVYRYASGTAPAPETPAQAAPSPAPSPSPASGQGEAPQETRAVPLAPWAAAVALALAWGFSRGAPWRPR